MEEGSDRLVREGAEGDEPSGFEEKRFRDPPEAVDRDPALIPDYLLNPGDLHSGPYKADVVRMHVVNLTHFEEPSPSGALSHGRVTARRRLLRVGGFESAVVAIDRVFGVVLA